MPGGQVPNTVIAQDMSAYDDFSMSEETAIRSSDTRYYTDPSIAAAALGIGPTT